MRHFVLMRHAKAEAGEGKIDYDRTLVERGWSEADATAKALAARGLAPETILVSASRRTRDTLAATLPHFPGDCIIHLRRSLYDADVTDLRDALRRSQGQRVLLIGHNPAVHELALEFAGSDASGAGLTQGFPTAHAAVFTLGFGLDTVRFEEVVRP
ncbi:SixA phosphatase family protein [Acuticoccus sp.]|uniref:SixA phosphatase family protein n=1 Tax=Acuticoccus sp. TaxID=1904378 RepID=UPI003B51C2FF